MRPSVFQPLFSLNNSRRIPRAVCAAAFASLATPFFDVSPHRHDGVADKFIEGAAVLKTILVLHSNIHSDAAPIPADRLLTQGGETDNVREKHRAGMREPFSDRDSRRDSQIL